MPRENKASSIQARIHMESIYSMLMGIGARYTMMNGAMVSGTSAKHKKTNTSTAEAEAEEAFHTPITTT